ncbi:MAG: hypothetical protein WDM77_05035 [Steroidobacteraceae bacterium]
MCRGGFCGKTSTASAISRHLIALPWTASRWTVPPCALASAPSASRPSRAAGDAPLTLSDRVGCIEAMTGAMLPIGCDTVVPVEDISVSSGLARLKDGVGR